MSFSADPLIEQQHYLQVRIRNVYMHLPSKGRKAYVVCKSNVTYTFLWTAQLACVYECNVCFQCNVTCVWDVGELRAGCIRCAWISQQI